MPLILNHQLRRLTAAPHNTVGVQVLTTLLGYRYVPLVRMFAQQAIIVLVSRITLTQI